MLFYSLENNYVRVVGKLRLQQVIFCFVLRNQILSQAHWKIYLQIAKLAKTLILNKISPEFLCLESTH